jgi:thiamine-monophosphate kinase
VAAGVRCGIDISDGLVQDIGHICERSGVGCELRLDAVPVDEHLRALYPDEARMMAATGGEDYELVLIGDAQAIARAGDALGAPLTTIGVIRVGRGVRVVDAGGHDVEVGAGGWDHLRGARDA